jgi:dihydroflavonol-4-reductase
MQQWVLQRVARRWYMARARRCKPWGLEILAQGDLVLVTGATGFVGAAVARAVRGAGFRLRVTARAGSDIRNLAGLGAETVHLDLSEPASFAPALSGCHQR